MKPSLLSAVPAADAAATLDRALSAKCPECQFREGPFDHVRKAREVLLKHINSKHRGLIDYLRAKPLPQRNEGFARAVAGDSMTQAAKLERLTKRSSLIVGADQAPPVDVAAEMITFIQNVNKVNAALLDILLEMRTGDPAIRWEMKGAAGDPAPEPPATEDPAPEDAPAPDALPGETPAEG
jgi:hypothetical protein